MFTTIAFLGMFILCFLSQSLEKFLAHRLVIILVIILELLCFLFAAYCLIAGISLLIGWEAPLRIMTETDSLPRTRRGGGLILLIINYWPYVLIGVSGVIGFANLLRIHEKLLEHKNK